MTKTFSELHQEGIVIINDTTIKVARPVGRVTVRREWAIDPTNKTVKMAMKAFK